MGGDLDWPGPPTASIRPLRTKRTEDRTEKTETEPENRGQRTETGNREQRQKQRRGSMDKRTEQTIFTTVCPVGPGGHIYTYKSMKLNDMKGRRD